MRPPAKSKSSPLGRVTAGRQRGLTEVKNPANGGQVRKVSVGAGKSTPPAGRVKPPARSNKGGAVRGQARATQVKGMNKARRSY